MQAAPVYANLEPIVKRITPANSVHADTFGILDRVRSELRIGHEPHFMEFLSMLRLFFPLPLNILESRLHIQCYFYIGAQTRTVVKFAFYHDVAVPFLP